MSTFSLMNIGASALSANQAALTTAGHNIANVNTAGYSRQQVLQTAREGAAHGLWFCGARRRCSVRFAHPRQFPSTPMRSRPCRSVRRMLCAPATCHSWRPCFQSASPAWVPRRPTCSARFQTCKACQMTPLRAQPCWHVRMNWPHDFNPRAYQIGNIQTRINEQMESDVIQINSLATQIASVNQQIFQYKGTNYSPNDLLDQRDQLVSDLNKLVQTTTIPAADGSLGVFIAGGSTSGARA
jgi:flagellar hook-associated protein 1 FlgK